MSHQSEEQPFQVVSRRNNGPSRKGPKGNHIKATSNGHEESSHKSSSKLRSSRETRSRSQSSHLSQERQRRDSDRQSTGERSRHNSTRGTSSDDQEFESSQEGDCPPPVANGVTIPETSPDNTHEGTSEEQLSSPPQETVPEPVPSKCEEATKTASRIAYSREFLLSLKDCKYKSNWPKLATITADCIKTDGKQRNPSPTGQADASRRHPTTAVSLIKENDSKAHRVSLSPQRRSFGSGCSWKEASTGNATPTEEAEVKRPPSKDRQTWEPSTKEKRGSKQQPKTYLHEEEPEWMEFGPSDRSEVIELKGLEEHEKGREDAGGVKKQVDEMFGKGERLKSGEEERGGRMQSCREGELEEKQEHTKTGTNDVKAEEEGKKKGIKKNKREEDTTQCGNQSARKDAFVSQNVGTDEECAPDGIKAYRQTEPSHSATPQRSEDNFIVDGFDFSTGVSICLAMDEDIEDSSGVGRSGVDETTELFKLMQTTESADNSKVLRARPANALTLEEIQARENITTSTSQQAESDHMPFNQILAVLSRGTAPSNGQASSNSQSSCASTMMAPNIVPPSPISVGMVPSTVQASNSNRGSGIHLDSEMDDNTTHHLPTANQHRVYLHYARPPPPPPRAPNHPYLHSYPSWGQNDPSTKPQIWRDEERASNNRQQYMALSQGQTHWVPEMEQRRQAEPRPMYAHQIHASYPSRGQTKSPGISLLPTAVMKRMHNTKATQRAPDGSTATGTDKLDQEVPFNGRDYTVQSPQHYSTPVFSSSSPLQFPIPGQQYSGFPGYLARYPGPYSR